MDHPKIRSKKRSNKNSSLTKSHRNINQQHIINPNHARRPMETPPTTTRHATYLRREANQNRRGREFGKDKSDGKKEGRKPAGPMSGRNKEASQKVTIGRMIKAGRQMVILRKARRRGITMGRKITDLGQKDGFQQRHQSEHSQKRRRQCSGPRRTRYQLLRHRHVQLK